MMEVAVALFFYANGLNTHPRTAARGDAAGPHTHRRQPRTSTAHHTPLSFFPTRPRPAETPKHTQTSARSPAARACHSQSASRGRFA